MVSHRSMVGRLLDAADALLAERENSSAFRRRAISTAYYAVFHALAGLCISEFGLGADRSSEIHHRVYRALDHGTLKTVVDQSPIKADEGLRQLGQQIVRLQSERIKADYWPPLSTGQGRAHTRETVASARSVVESLETLNPESRRTLMVCLLFRKRGA